MVRLGNEEFLANLNRYAAKKTIGLVINHTSFTPSMKSVLGVCIHSSEAKVRAVFGPEHGAHGAMQDMENVPDAKLPGGVPLYSLYGADENTLSPALDVMAELDALVIDLQDVGSRYYTFIWTMLYCMEACAKSDTEVIICDRPNPLGGTVAGGPVQQSDHLSFVGRFPMPVRHGMTVGEIALLLKDRVVPQCKVTVIPMKGWRRGMFFDETGLPWISPSPNMPSLSTAIVYPGGCMVEGTTLSEGRGTTTPFEQIGAPGLNAEKLAAHMNEKKAGGCVFRPVAFIPKFQKYADRVCAGIYIHVVDRNAFDAFRVYAQLIREIAVNFPASFGWRTDAYEFVDDKFAIDLLTGSNRFRTGVDQAKETVEIFEGAIRSEELFVEMRKDYLLYD